ncbi:MAG: substrate-binding domain-containing protein [Bacteroidaceae bacterium]|nr:substrate-binding domain-containing protein [Bacteroidaceae bacterium]
MKSLRYVVFGSLLMIVGLSGCVEEEETYAGFENLTFEEWPLTDCSTSTSPLRDIVAFKLLGVPYKWGEHWITMGTYKIYPDFTAAEGKFSSRDFYEKNQCSGTHGAYMNLMKGQTDVIIASRDISRNEKDSANLLGVELETAPLATDALVFIVNPKNPVKNLSTEQLKGIYTGKITNWKEVGGEDHTITPYLRDADSGSQEKMETLVMRGLKMVDGPELVGSSMMSPYLQLENDEYGIAYTPYYYRTVMMRDLIKVNVLSIDGVTPDKKSLREGKYPFTSSIYAAVRQSEPHESMAYRLYEFLFTKKGGKMVDESGYIALQN